MDRPQRQNPAWLKLAVDYGPLLAYFLAYRWWSPKGPAGTASAVAEMLALTRSTAVFVVATLAAVLVSKWRFGRIEPMLWISAALVTVMGAMTVLLHDSFWIQVKPTLVYLLLAGALLGGWLRGKALLRYLMGPAFEGLDEEGWLTVSRNWGLLFAGFAVLNELVRWRYNTANGGFGTWLALKLWLFMPLSVVFAMAHVPYLLRHGLDGAQSADNPDKAG